MKKTIWFFGTIAVMSASVALGATETMSDSYEVALDGLDAFDCEGETKWEQLPNGLGNLASQEDCTYPFLAESADNFVGDGDDMIGVGWWGGYWSGSPLAPDAFNVVVYADDGGAPGDVIYTHNSTEYNETIGSPNGYCTEIEAFNKADGVTYWLSVQAVLCYPPRWGWAAGEGDGTEGYLRYPFAGIPDFANPSQIDGIGIFIELAYVLYNAEGPVPVEEATWSKVKSLYQ